MEIVAVEPGLWQLSGRADRDSVDAFFRAHSGKAGAHEHSDGKILVKDVEVIDSTILALLIHWRLDDSRKVSFEIHDAALLNLIKLHRIEHLFDSLSAD